MSEVVQPPLEEYPVQTTPGRFELIEAETLYKFVNPQNNDGRWLAVCKVKSTFQRRDGSTGSSLKVRVYRWRWRERRTYNPDTQERLGTGEYRWTREEVFTPSPKYWVQTRDLIEKWMKEIR